MGLTKGAPYKGRGEGHFPHAQTRGEAPSPGAQERADLSPQAGRGEAARRQLNLALMGTGPAMTSQKRGG
jgi:hypothetical protein